jgi:seryl-tRNA synthetase
VLHRGLAKLQRALISFMLDTHTNEHGYREAYVPCTSRVCSLKRHVLAAA